MSNTKIIGINHDYGVGRYSVGEVRKGCVGGVCAVLCQYLHDAMGGHGVVVVGGTCRGCERRGRECSLNVTVWVGDIFECNGLRSSLGGRQSLIRG